MTEPDVDEGLRKVYLEGAYDMCALLLTSPRMNRPQRDLIESQAYKVKDQMEALGVAFSEASALEETR